MRTICLYPFFVTLVRVFGPQHLRVFSDLPAASCYHPLISISFLLAFSSNPIRSFWQHTLASDQVLAFLTNIRRAEIIATLLRARLFIWLSYKRMTSAGKYEPHLSRSRFARVHPGRASQNQNPIRPGWTAREETCSFSRHAAVELGRGDPRQNETQARGESGKTLR